MRFLIKSNHVSKVVEVKGVSDRIALIKLQINNTLLTKIQIYAPAAASKEEQSDNLYKELSGQIIELKDKKNLIRMEDWNSQVGLKEKGEGAA